MGTLGRRAAPAWGLSVRVCRTTDAGNCEMLENTCVVSFLGSLGVSWVRGVSFVLTKWLWEGSWVGAGHIRKTEP